MTLNKDGLEAGNPVSFEDMMRIKRAVKEDKPKQRKATKVKADVVQDNADSE